MPLLLEACAPAAPATKPADTAGPGGNHSARRPREQADLRSRCRAGHCRPGHRCIEVGRWPRPADVHAVPGPQARPGWQCAGPRPRLLQVPGRPGQDRAQAARATAARSRPSSYLTLAPPPAMDQNAAWQAVNKAHQRHAQHGDGGRRADYRGQGERRHRRQRPAGLHLQPDHDQPDGRDLGRCPQFVQGEVRRPDAPPQRRRRQGVPQPRPLHDRTPGSPASSRARSTASRRRARRSAAP